MRWHWPRSEPPGMDRVPSPRAVQTALACWHSTRARLLTDDADLAQDEEQLATLLGAETEDLAEIKTHLARAIVVADQMATVADAMGADLLARRNRYRRRVLSYKAALLAILDAVGASRFEAPDVTVSMRAGPPAVVVTDEKQLPERFFRIETTRKVDKAALNIALRDGEVIDGAMLSNGPTGLSVRSK
jgi:hypothetical protein